MPRGRNKEFIIAGIRNLLVRNYRIDYDIIDLESEVDTKLTFCENWGIIHGKYIRPVYREAFALI